MTQAEVERSKVSVWLENDFDAHASVLLELCCDESDRPLYFNHVRLAVASTSGPELSPEVIDTVCRAYVYLTASYYIADAIADGHACHKSTLDVAELAQRLSLFSCAAAAKFVEVASAHGLSSEASRLLCETLAENTSALEAEDELRSSEFNDWASEAFHMWGRSNSFLFLLRYVGLLRGITIPGAFLDTVKRLLVAIQRGDDSCDWRKDLFEGAWTPFLRACFPMSSRAELSPESAEEFIYLSGRMEEELEAVSVECESVIAALQGFPNGAALVGLAKDHLNRARAKRAAFISAKRLWA